MAKNGVAVTMAEKITHRVELSYACYAIVTIGDMIIEAAPIAKWAEGKTLAKFTSWVNKKGGTVKPLSEALKNENHN